jgi:hypothetical protein
MDSWIPIIANRKTIAHNTDCPDSITLPDSETLKRILQVKSTISFYSSAIYGNRKVFVPRWSPEFAFTDPQYFTPYKWTHMYDHSSLVNTAERYIDYKKTATKRPI